MCQTEGKRARKLAFDVPKSPYERMRILTDDSRPIPEGRNISAMVELHVVGLVAEHGEIGKVAVAIVTVLVMDNVL